MIKKTIRYTSYLLVLLGFGGTSCGGGDDEKKDFDCYECTKDGDTYEYCFSYYKENYGWSRDEFEDYIDYLEGEGYVCEAIE
jgi:hypothetical protein